jgi:DNA repair protein RecN (Recombination protein N)
MLRALAIRNLALIEAVDMRLEPGLNVLTGETGSGKSILLDALGFALGWRGRAGLVRPGAAQGEVVAEFTLAADHPAHAVLAEAGLDAGDELLLRRTVAEDGRAGAYLNDRRVAAETLRALADTLVEIHGQNAERGLLDPRGHRALLDAFAGTDQALAATRAAWTALRAAETRLAEAEAGAAEAARDADYLRHAVAELDALDPQPGGEPELDARRRALQAAARSGEALAAAAAALGPAGAEGALIEGLRRLEDAAARGGEALDEGLAPPIEAVGRALAELAEADRALTALIDTMEADPATLEATEERLFALRAAARKHALPPEDLPALAEALRARLALIDGGAATIAAARTARVVAAGAYEAAAAALTARRREAAAALDARIAAELPPLKLEAARFTTEIAPAEPGPDGADRITFTVATAPGAPSGPINRIASGGELSRLMLALKVCLADRSTGLTLIFDEIDRGVGGATADAVGRRLAALAATAQVLVVTHSPQVAARAGHHWLVGKTAAALNGAAPPRTEIARLAPAAREREIARMLAGDTVTDEARAAARALIAG